MIAMKNKVRLDKLLVDLGFFDSRQKAQTCIMSNGVFIAGSLVNKAGTQITEEVFYQAYEQDSDYLRVENKLMPYVSRGAFKLKHAAEKFSIDFQEKVILDIGASTGGFTDYALKNSATKVFAVDTGKAQLDYKLRQDKRVVNLEEQNFRHIDASLFTEKIDIVTIDVSFISLALILEKLFAIRPVLHDTALIVALIKPQFEAGKEIMDKCRGVIRDEKIRQEVLNQTLEKINKVGFTSLDLIESPIKGAKGNIEFLQLLKL